MIYINKSYYVFFCDVCNRHELRHKACKRGAQAQIVDGYCEDCEVKPRKSTIVKAKLLGVKIV